MLGRSPRLGHGRSVGAVHPSRATGRRDPEVYGPTPMTSLAPDGSLRSAADGSAAATSSATVDDVAPSRVRSVRYISLHERSGYGIAAERAILGLLDAGIAVSWVPMAMGDHHGYEIVRRAPGAHPRLDAIIHAEVEPDVTVAHVVPEHFDVLAARYPVCPFVGETVWETTAPPPHWPDLLNRTDAVIVPCRWNVDLFEQAGVTVPMHVVPHLPANVDETGTDAAEDLTAAGSPTIPGLDDPDIFVFYSINTWTARKDNPRTIAAYLDAFGPDDRVLLVLKTGAHDHTGLAPPGGGALDGSTAWTVASQLQARGDGPPLRVLTHRLSDAELRALHRRGDGYVSLSRSEGFGIGVFDAAMAGRPVVTTGWGGHLEYLDRACSYLVDYDLVPVVDPTGASSYRPDQRWAEASISHGAALLREVYERRDEARDRASRQAERLRHEHSPAAGTAKLLAALDDVIDGTHR